MTDAATQSEQRKLLGAFYTESDTANAIARLAVNRSDEAVLDPCFGGCAFLEAVRNRFVALGNDAPMRRVFGVDVDPKAQEFLKAVRGARPKQFLVRDFLDLTPGAFGSAFDVVVGNPPFIRHHRLTNTAVTNAQARLASNLRVPKTADSWLYFFHHSLQFLRRGGCLAMVLPGSFLNAAYAESARHAMVRRFAYGDLFLVRRRLFADALESPVIVIARGFEEPPQRCRLSVVDSPDEIVSAFVADTGSVVDLTEKSGPWRLALVPERSREALSAVTHREDVAQFGSIATIHIGVVTGANQFFTLSDSDAKAHRLPESALRPILSTSKQFHGLEVTASDLKKLRQAGERVLLLDTNGQRRGARLDAYLSTPAAKEAQRAFKCRDRTVWHELDDLTTPDAFLSYVIDRVPRLVLNTARALSTNAIHRVRWREKASSLRRQGWALSMTSSLGGLSAELYGRVSGGGALKLEPGEAAALWVPTSFSRQGTAKSFSSASKAIRAGEWEKARAIADRAILVDELGLGPREVSDLRAGHDALLALRFSLAARAKRRAV